MTQQEKNELLESMHSAAYDLRQCIRHLEGISERIVTARRAMLRLQLEGLETDLQVVARVSPGDSTT